MIIELKEYLNKIVGVEMQLEVASDDKFGDYATNVAFGLGKEQKRLPMVVAQELVEKIKAADIEKVFENVEAAAPGFLNFKISREYLVKNLADVSMACNSHNTEKSDVRDQSLQYLGHRTSGKKIKKINLEFVSGNPTGPLTMANARGGFLGDVLANVLESVGHEVTREYYINDAGVQVKKLGESVLAALDLAPKLEEHYQGKYVEELADKYKEELSGLTKNSEEAGRLIAKDLLGQIKKSVEGVGIKFDNWFSENENLRKKKLLEKALSVLRERKMVYEKEGATWLKADGEDKDYVLVKSDGEPTYFLGDIAYHYNKFVTRNFEIGIDIWGADHHGYVARLKAGLAAMGIDQEKLKIILVQLVRLVRGDEEVRMSKRKGEFITLDELVAEAGEDATRWFFLMYSPNTHMDFDLSLAKEKSSKNPVYYVQYAYTRAYAILEKATRNIATSDKISDKRQLINYKFETEDELRLIKQLVQLPDVLVQTAEDYQVSRLTRYATELASAFHNFYEKERAITDNVAETEMRLALVDATKTILEKLFKILGISALEKM